jgi:hypothetical protein
MVSKRFAKWGMAAVIPLALTIVWLRAQSANRIMLLTAQETATIAREAFIFGYPLVTTKITGMAFTNTEKPDPATLQAPWNQLVNQPGYPPATYHGVTAPNADTLYSAAFLDLSKEPVVLSYPDMGKRYFLFPIYDAWTNVIHSAGSRTSGDAAQSILITGPGWQGTPPAGLMHVKSGTNLAFIIGRVYSDGTPADLAKVHALQKQFQLVPLSAHGHSYTPPAGQTGGPYTPKQVVRDVIAAMSTEEYFTFLADAMKDNPPVLPRDAAVVARMAKIGLVPGKPFDMSRIDPDGQKAIQDLPKKVTAEFNKMEAESLGKTVHGWGIPAACGRFGTDYRNRAVVSAYGWGCNLPHDAVYPLAKVDAKGNPLNGSNTYVMHFKTDDALPVRGFWSITMYDKDYYFYPNELNKLTLSRRDRLEYNPDGSLNLYFSHAQPDGVPEANWLPAPEDDFILMMRLYWPRETPPSILPPNKPTWAPPPVKMQTIAGRAKLPAAAVQAAPL